MMIVQLSVSIKLYLLQLGYVGDVGILLEYF
jgi:hypothetical protein